MKNRSTIDHAGSSAIYGIVVLLIIALFCPLTTSAQEGYEGGRGLISLEGPAGMFLNPTSGTFPENAGTAQYCIYFPNNKSDVVGHGLLVSYGLSDTIEVGGQWTYVDLDAGSLSAGGINGRVRLREAEGNLPEVSIVGWSRIVGDDELERLGLAAAAFRRFPMEEDGPIKAVGVHAGVKYLSLSDEAAGANDDTSISGYAGVEVQLPLRIYALVEASTKDSDFGNEHTPWAYGFQWRAAGIAMSFAGIQNGRVNDPSFYWGIGYGREL